MCALFRAMAAPYLALSNRLLGAAHDRIQARESRKANMGVLAQQMVGQSSIRWYPSEQHTCSRVVDRRFAEDMGETGAIKSVRRRLSQAEVEELVGECEASGLTRPAFCAGRGLSVATVDRGGWRIRRRDVEALAERAGAGVGCCLDLGRRRGST